MSSGEVRRRLAGVAAIDVHTPEVAIFGLRVLTLLREPAMAGMIDSPSNQAVGLKSDALRSIRDAALALGLLAARP